MNAVVVTALFTPRPGAHDELVAALRESIPAVHAEPGCILYAIHDGPDERIVMIEKWESREMLDAHTAGEPVRELNARIAPHIAEPVHVEILAPLPAGETEKGLL